MLAPDWDRVLNIVPPFLDREELHQRLNGKTVVVSGAGGTVGRSLTQGLTDFTPRRIILLDHCEHALHTLSQLLRESPLPFQSFRFALGDLTNARYIERLFKDEKPDVVFHAAAYKHVPLSEDNAHVVVENNVAATLTLLKTSVIHAVDYFVHVSSDKSVDPIGVMGATKRLSELLVAAFRRQGFQRYYSVRFGNILGSSGSLTEYVCEDLALGRNLLITDSRMTRWFTTPNLVIHSLLMSLYEHPHADVLIPKCHQEKKILDLVKSIASLITDNKSIPAIKYIGIRKGEKLSERLLGRDDVVVRETNWFLDVQIASPVSPDLLFQRIAALLDDAHHFRRNLLERLQACLTTEESAHLYV